MKQQPAGACRVPSINPAAAAAKPEQVQVQEPTQLCESAIDTDTNIDTTRHDINTRQGTKHSRRAERAKKASRPSLAGAAWSTPPLCIALDDDFTHVTVDAEPFGSCPATNDLHHPPSIRHPVVRRAPSVVLLLLYLTK
ncbi:hypothetical protein MGYG_00671 [Nannizzia gypsea CBS 118893]|uniref:Uncharacterized protein n=1 Tax=Arthroderma gypseum (strain ATCC MYA-4604 / CBS 118893) TaxID=535722 RepID=E5R129_ARTGP|nr:hypothetical protein MGYG_00671 [Nannizzia gypsea CBS 118893]EFQ97633.1 hypothetical protein MGYG_00671 [Nannizzia gypsea CBS 118893]